MRSISRLSHVGTIVLFLLLQACASPSLAPPQATESQTSTKPLPTDTNTPTATPRPAEATRTEFARQAEGTRQVLVDTQVALAQNADATATSRALDATATALAPLPPVDVQIDVQSEVPWQDTGLQVRRGNRVQVIYLAGEWSIWVGADPMTDGDGQTGRPEDCRLMPEANLGGLIGRVGENPPFYIGNEADIFSEYDGTLQLSMNDCTPFESNGGSLTVQVIIER